MLDRERADFYRVLDAAREQLSDRCVAIQLPIGAEHELRGVVDLLHMCAYLDPSGGKEGGPQPIPDELAELVAEYREKLLDAVVETDEDLMARYLEGEELPAEDVAAALKDAVTRDELYPVACGVATKNLGTTALLDLLVEGVPSPERKGTTIEFGDAKQAVFVFKTIADPFAGRISCFRVLAGPVTGDTTLVDPRTHAKERLGQVLLLQGKDSEAVDALGVGDLGAVAKLKDVVTGDVLVDHEVPVEPPHIDFPEPVMSFAITPEGEGRRGEDGDRAPPPQRGGPDARHAPRPADRRAAPLGALADAGRGGRRPAAAAASTSTSSCTRRASPTRRRSARRRAPGTATRSRPAAAASSATARS